MSKTIEFNTQRTYSKDDNISIDKDRNSYMLDSLVNSSSKKKTLKFKKNNKLLRNKFIREIFINNYTTNFPTRENRHQLNRYLHSYINLPKISHNSKKVNKIKILDRPIYNYILDENTMPYKTNRVKKKEIDKNNDQLLFSMLSTTDNQNKNNNNLLYDYYKFKNNNNSNKKKKFNYFLNTLKNKDYDYFPKLLDSKRDIMINKKNDKFKDKSLLFSELKDLNFDTEFKNTTIHNFITPEKFLAINPRSDANFLEKKTTYRILDKIKFKIKTPEEKSKLKNFIQNFNSVLTINKFY